MALRNWLLPLLPMALLPAGAQAQNSDYAFLFGPALAGNQTIGGSNVTVTGSTGLALAFGSGAQVLHRSAASLWVDLHIVDTNPRGSAPIQGSASANSQLFVPFARWMLPVHARISLFGALGGGFGYFHNYDLSSDVPPQLKVSKTYHGVFGAGGGVDFRVARHVSIRVDIRDYVTGRGLGGVNGRNHFVPLAGIALHF